MYEQLEQIAKEWRTPGDLERLHARTLFYQFIYELIRQLREQDVQIIRAEPAEQALKYLHEHYAEPLTLEFLASLLDCSPSHLSRIFKQRTACSPIEYMIRLRISRAKSLLANTEAPLQKIALSIGYVDVYYFSRIFKKHTGQSPLRYRETCHDPIVKQHNPLLMLRSSIVPDKLRRYINKRNDNHYQYTDKGALHLIRNRKQSTALTVLLSLTLLLSACSGVTNNNINATASSGSTSDSTASGNNGQAETNQTTAASATVKYTGADGEVEIPRNPQRIVILTHAYVGYFMALGINPVGAPTMTMGNPFYKGKIDGMEDIGAPDAFSNEKIITLNPDLIIALKGTKNLEEISKIAPVVTINYGEKNYKEQLLDFGKMTNRTDAAQQWVDNWEKKIAEYKPQVLLAVGDQTVSVLSQTGKSVSIYGEGYGRGTEILYDEFGLKGPQAFDLKLGWAEFSLEKLPEFAGDYIFTSPDASENEDSSPMYTSDLWNKLPAIKNKRVFYIDKKSAAFNDPITLDALLPIVVDSLTSAAGDKS
ncbi:AraC family transcriptional regulator [Cohnella abietis]|uniref:AraC family transcriptional regulator n=1 Tax=Cohnella abietis TaxID=2507935 RepID=UPI0013904B5E|nr:AraC family transcriptional regulator [Cohnella abietis]